MRQHTEETTITSGSLRGRKIRTPGSGTHPMGSREKLALFNMISGYSIDAKVLDAYAGSGALGIEALSRGAESVVFVDKSTEAARTIKENLSSLGVSPEVVQVIREDVSTFAGEAKEFDIVFADPPYDKYVPEMIEELRPLIKQGGFLVTSTPVEPPEMQGFELIKTKKYARAHISIYKK